MAHFHIAGAGIAGVAAAIALARNDLGVTILEQAQQFSEVGAGLQLGPNAVRALQRLGAWDAVSQLTYQPPEIHVRDGKSGKLLQRVELGLKFEQRFGVPYRVIHRADLHKALVSVLNGLNNVEMITGKKIASVGHSGRDVKIKLQSGEQVYAEALLAADGTNSTIRKSLFPNSPAITLPCTVLRNMARSSESFDVHWDAVNLWLCPKGHVVHYPIADKINLVIVNEAVDYSNWFAPLRHFLESQENYTSWQAQYVQPLQKWHQGYIGLIGDAAHGTVPYLAQGAAQSLQDAAFMRQIGSKPPVELFEALYKHRARQATIVHHASLSAGSAYHLSGITAAIRNIILSSLSDYQFLSRLSKVYGAA